MACGQKSMVVRGMGKEEEIHGHWGAKGRVRGIQRRG